MFLGFMQLCETLGCNKTAGRSINVDSDKLSCEGFDLDKVRKSREGL